MNEKEAWERYVTQIDGFDAFDMSNLAKTVAVKEAFISGFRAAQPKNKFVVTLYVDAEQSLSNIEVANKITSRFCNSNDIIVTNRIVKKEGQTTP